MSIRKNFAVDYDAVTKGRDFEIDGMIFKLAHLGYPNKNWAKAHEQATKPFRQLIASDMLDEKTDERLGLDVFLETVLLDWKGVKIEEDGPEIPFSKEAARKVLTDWPEFYRQLRHLASAIGHFRPVGSVKTDSGN